MFGISEFAILALVVVLIFGAKKLPELARSLGKSARILKSEAKAMKADGSKGPAAGAAGGAGSPVIEGVVVDGPAARPREDGRGA
ncbi:Sec-independent protein translocase subunit TatA [Streptomyces sp. BI20]|uniref:Sec-independent protein translocase subunit TatA n=1 Tax=Streptomyces sp. BI20 TaxID=3403460 RepID=UPI003C7212B8